jgi:hypothetical protein
MQLLSEKVEPKSAKSKTDTDAPIRANRKIENVEPILANALIDMEDAM